MATRLVGRAATCLLDKRKSETCLEKVAKGFSITLMSGHVQKISLENVGDPHTHPSKRKSLPDGPSAGSDVLGCAWVSTPVLALSASSTLRALGAFPGHLGGQGSREQD